MPNNKRKPVAELMMNFTDRRMVDLDLPLISLN